MASDRRIHARRPVTRPYVAHLLSPIGRLITVALPADISQSGLRIDAPRAVTVGDRLLLEPQRPHPLGGRRFPFAVVWTGPAMIGGVFVTPITEAEMAALAPESPP